MSKDTTCLKDITNPYLSESKIAPRKGNRKMNSPPLAEFLDKIKERFESSEIPSMYKVVKIPAIYDGSMSVVCNTEIVYDYEDLCIKMFDLDVLGWEIFGEITSETQKNIYLGSIYNMVTIRLTGMT